MSSIEYGVSLSTIVCRNYGITTKDVVAAVFEELPIRRFRLMSYWSEIESEQGVYDFGELDEQIKQIDSSGGTVTLCLGMRQPRWPECHVPEWAKRLAAGEREERLLKFIEKVVQRYRSKSCIVSYQLENEALNKGIGTCEDFSRARLRREFEHVKSLDPGRPIIMTTSNSWGLPVRGPVPDAIGFSYYLYEWGDDGPTNKPIPRWIHSGRRRVAALFGKPSFCHELQAEPWGPVGNEDMSDEQQIELMDAERLKKHIRYAQKTGVNTIDLWGLEWWYWRKVKRNDPSLWAVIEKLG